MSRFIASVLLLVLAGIGSVHAATVEEVIAQAGELMKAGNLDEAASLLEQASAEHPESSDVHANLGLYFGMLAGQASDMVEAGRLSSESFRALDRAVALDPDNPVARHHRGLMGVKVPAFLGKLDQGIEDLEHVIALSEMSAGAVPDELVVSTYELLAEGYEKRGEAEHAIGALKSVTELAPGSSSAELAEENIDRLSTAGIGTAHEGDSGAPARAQEATGKTEPGAAPARALELLGSAWAHVNSGEYEQARAEADESIGLDPTNVDAYKVLVMALGGIAETGYDNKIAEDTDLMTNLAFDVMKAGEKAVELAPDDLEVRLMRGSIGVMMPFFVGKLDQSIADLEMVVAGNASDEFKAEALYYLGYAARKRATTYWIDVVSNYGDTDAANMVFEQIHPMVPRVEPSDYKGPFVAIDFVLGFQDELPPQTAVWVEDAGGRFVKTIYASGFSGHAKRAQVNLPIWSGTSEFADADVVTGASIDIGHHLYVWELDDASGARAATGAYTVKVETVFWPSMQSQLVEATIDLATQDRVVVREGNIVPYLELTYSTE